MTIINRQKINNLLEKYAGATGTPAENKLFEGIILRNPIKSNWNWSSEERKVLVKAKIKARLDEQRLNKKRLHLSPRWYIRIAASIILIMSISLWHQNHNSASDVEIIDISKNIFAEPKAVNLKLANGTIINLDQHVNGFIISADGFLIKKIGADEIVYQFKDRYKIKKSHFREMSTINSIHIPSGRKLQMTLLDGTKVWLNTATTFTYPTTFEQNQRNVKLDGEAYFEVAKDNKRPFSVLANGVKISVLGTKFNVNNYLGNHKVTTTLLEGSVRVVREGQSLLLNPGLKAIVYDKVSKIEIQKANIENIKAWRNGYFVFDSDIVSVMKEVARWYGIKVIFKGPLSRKKIGGTFPMTSKLNELLSDLESLADVKIKKVGGEVIIMH